MASVFPRTVAPMIQTVSRVSPAMGDNVSALLNVPKIQNAPLAFSALTFNVASSPSVASMEIVQQVLGATMGFVLLKISAEMMTIALKALAVRMVRVFRNSNVWISNNALSTNNASRVSASSFLNVGLTEIAVMVDSA